MRIVERVVDGVTILDLQGRMTLGDDTDGLRDAVRGLLHQGRMRILLNLAAVPYVDSAGLQAICREHTTVSRLGGRLKLLHLTKRITDLLAITKLTSVYETFEDEPAAVKSFTQ